MAAVRRTSRRASRRRDGRSHGSTRSTWLDWWQRRRRRAPSSACSSSARRDAGTRRNRHQLRVRRLLQGRPRSDSRRTAVPAPGRHRRRRSVIVNEAGAAANRRSRHRPHADRRHRPCRAHHRRRADALTALSRDRRVRRSFSMTRYGARLLRDRAPAELGRRAVAGWSAEGRTGTDGAKPDAQRRNVPDHLSRAAADRLTAVLDRGVRPARACARGRRRLRRDGRPCAGARRIGLRPRSAPVRGTSFAASSAPAWLAFAGIAAGIGAAAACENREDVRLQRRRPTRRRSC